jgi:hypothetical protein
VRCRELDIFKNLGFFWEIFGNFEEIFGRKILGGIFGRNILGGIFWEEFFGRNFLGGIFGRNFLGGILWELSMIVCIFKCQLVSYIFKVS